VTHDQEEALEVADRIVVMSHGKVEHIGPRPGERLRLLPRRVRVFEGALVAT
jgi:ABC-type sulfate/molybdate transport systems ATPase subunit